MTRTSKLHAADKRAQKAAPSKRRKEQLTMLQPMGYDVARGDDAYVASVRNAARRSHNDGRSEEATDAEVLSILVDMEHTQAADIISALLIAAIYDMDHNERTHKDCRDLAACRRARRHLTAELQTRVEVLRKEANTIARAIRAAVK